MKYKVVQLAVLFLLVGAVFLSGCDWSGTTISGTVRISSAVAPDQPGVILLLINDDDRYPLSTLDEDWSPEDWSPERHNPGIIVPSGRMDGATGSYDRIVYYPATMEYFYWHSELQYNATEVFLGAFVDLDDNGRLDAGEPWGPCEINPLQELVDDSSRDAPNEADIIIDRILEGDGEYEVEEEAEGGG